MSALHFASFFCLKKDNCDYTFLMMLLFFVWKLLFTSTITSKTCSRREKEFVHVSCCDASCADWQITQILFGWLEDETLSALLHQRGNNKSVKLHIYSGRSARLVETDTCVSLQSVNWCFSTFQPWSYSFKCSSHPCGFSQSLSGFGDIWIFYLLISHVNCGRLWEETCCACCITNAPSQLRAFVGTWLWTGSHK